MQVYKVYFKLIRKKIPLVLFLFLILWGVMVAFFRGTAHSGNDDFSITKVPIAFINEDEENVLIRSVEGYLKRTCSILEVGSTTQEINDALCHRQIYCVVTIPKGFTEAVLNGNGAMFSQVGAKNGNEGVFVQISLKKVAGILQKEWKPGITKDSLSERIDSKKETEIKFSYCTKYSKSKRLFMNYLNIGSYVMFYIFMLCICNVTSVFYNKNIEMRNYVSPVSTKKIHKKLLCAHLCFLMAVTGLFVVGGIFLSYPLNLDVICGLMIVNVYVFSMFILSFSFLLGVILKGKEYTGVIINMIAIGMSFFGGAFVSQDSMGATIRGIAKFVPSYWFIRINTELVNSGGVSMGVLTSFGKGVLILILFALLNIVWGLIIAKETINLQ